MDVKLILLIILGLATLPFGYVKYFLIIELRNRLGIMKFMFLVLLYLIGLAFLVSLLESGAINLVCFVFTLFF
jgi:hypothetical protein